MVQCRRITVTRGTHLLVLS